MGFYFLDPLRGLGCWRLQGSAFGLQGLKRRVWIFWLRMWGWGVIGLWFCKVYGVGLKLLEKFMGLVACGIEGFRKIRAVTGPHK